MNRFLLALAFVISGPVLASQSPVSTITLTDGRTIVTDAKQITLYTFDVDNGSESKCYNACAKAWPPLLVPAGTDLADPLAVTERTDGTLQVTIEGKPVYYFAGDEIPGDITGDGLQGVWHIIVK